MRNIKKFEEFSDINESLVQNKSMEQLKMVRRLSKGTDIGDRITDMSKEGSNLNHIHNVIDSGVESFQDFEAKNKKFIPGWNSKNLTDPFKGNKK